MSAPGSLRSKAELNRGPSAAILNARSRVPSFRASGKEHPLPSGEIIPEDSASNAPSRKPSSGAYKANGTTTEYASNSKERVQVKTKNYTREKVQVRTRSPVKKPSDESFGQDDGLERTHIRQAEGTSKNQVAMETERMLPSLH